MAQHQVDMDKAGKPSQALTIAKPRKATECTYTQPVAIQVLDRLAKGETLRAICRDKGMPPESTFRDWVLRSNEGRLAGEDECGWLSAQYTRAREMGYHTMAEEILDISDDNASDIMEGGAINHANVQRSKLRVDSRKWLLSKALPKVYGERVEHQVEHKQVDATPQDLAKALLDMGLDAKLINGQAEPVEE